jgi:hypothetical protein
MVLCRCARNVPYLPEPSIKIFVQGWVSCKRRACAA